MAKESSQHKLSRVRPPRVQIQYDVERGGASKKRELPFVVGVLADLSGKPDVPLPKPKERQFVDLDKGNFDVVLDKAMPRLTFQVENTLKNDGSMLNVELTFRKLEDFAPERLADQIEPLKRLVEARNRLTNLIGKMDGNDKLESLLEDIMVNTEKLKQLQSETGWLEALGEPGGGEQ
jgi:type VI secretion system protein ImpB